MYGTFDFHWRLINKSADRVLSLVKQERPDIEQPIRQLLPVYDGASAQRLANGLRDFIQGEGTSNIEDALKMLQDAAQCAWHMTEDSYTIQGHVDTLNRLTEGVPGAPQQQEQTKQRERQMAGATSE